MQMGVLKDVNGRLEQTEIQESFCSLYLGVTRVTRVTQGNPNVTPSVTDSP